MRILIDTNIFSYRENSHIIPSNLQSLLKTLNDLVVQILVHPLAARELERDKNQKRREITLSKIKTYPMLDNPPHLENDRTFRTINAQKNNAHELVDNNLLYCVYKNAADFLITEDRGIHRKSDRLGISDRVFDIDEALEYFGKQLSVEKVPKLQALKYVPVHNVDIHDPIFTSLREEYPDFIDWWEKISREGRKARVYFKGNRLGAILIYKIEDEAIASNPPLPKKRRLKISTFKVTYTGYKIGELFIKISTMFAINNNTDELYLTHFTKPDDYLAELIEKFGFYKVKDNIIGSYRARIS
jgi:predicted nucleic acid-binding protein